MGVNTKTAPHRTLEFGSLDDVLAEVERIERGMEAGTARTTGNWSIGEIGEHCAKFLAAACDGFETKAPAPLRFVARLLFFKKAMGDEPMPRGFQLPRQASFLLPTPGIDDAEGLGLLRKELKRVLAGKRMDKPSPLLGPLTHEQWVVLQCKHCAMHLGFVHPEG